MALLSQSLPSLRFSQAKRRTPLVHPLYHTTTSIKRSHDLSICLASSNPTNNSAQLPIFPLPLVLFPGAMFPLYISKSRDRVMMNNLLQTETDQRALHGGGSELAGRGPPPDPAQGDDIEKLASEVEDYMKGVMRISNRLEGKKQDNQKADVDIRKGQFPTPFSFYVTSTFDSPTEQQVLLELEDTATRLKREWDTLKSTLNYLTDASALL